MPEARQTVFVTGAGSGMGLATALFLAARNYRVFGSVLTEKECETLSSESQRRGVTVDAVKMDVTRRPDIDRAIEALLSATGRIDAVVHFAGMGLRGFFEDLTLEEIRAVYDVNVFGIMAVTQAVLPHMRENRRGRIVVVSSAAGRMGSMSISGYCSSKFAVEGFAECLALEVRPFNIFVSLLEPALIWTPHFTVNRNRARRAVDPNSPYYRWFCQHEKLVDDIMARDRFTCEDVAALVHRIVTAKRPRLRYVIGGQVKLIFALRRYIPGEWFERIYWAIVRRMVTRPRVQATGLSGVDDQPEPASGQKHSVT